MKINKEVEKFGDVRNMVNNFISPLPDIYDKVDYKSVESVVFRLFYWPVVDAIIGSVERPILDNIKNI